ncbi:hypothetical protein [Streptomyces sp. NPDC086010]|uniref:hypothetical protein n=1 Tax=Streptomyces sp. NPDC086010 TaxID=3365745 RepID=UPI0037D0F3CC
MDTTTRATLVAALAAGYVIGRTRQGKLVLGLLALASGKSLDPKRLIDAGTQKLTENPQFVQLAEQVREELLTSGRGALSEATDRGVASLSENLQERLLALTGAPDDALEGELEDEYTDDDDEGPEDEESEDEGPEEEPADEVLEESRSPRRRRTTRVTPEQPTDRKPGPENPPAKRAMARKAAQRKPGPKNPPARKAMARKAADDRAAGKKAPRTRGTARPPRGRRR